MKVDLLFNSFYLFNYYFSFLFIFLCSIQCQFTTKNAVINAAQSWAIAAFLKNVALGWGL